MVDKWEEFSCGARVCGIVATASEEPYSEPRMPLARSNCREHGSPIEDTAAEHDMPNRISYLSRARYPRGHEVIVLQDGFLRVRQTNDMA